MKKFRFKLEPFLKLKEMAEKQKLYELAQVTGQIDKNNQIIEFYYSESERLGKQLNVKIADSRISMFQLTQHYLMGLRQKMQVAERENLQLQDELQKRQAALTQARREKKTVEVLKKRRYEEYKATVLKEELAEIDDHNNKRLQG